MGDLWWSEPITLVQEHHQHANLHPILWGLLPSRPQQLSVFASVATEVHLKQQSTAFNMLLWPVKTFLKGALDDMFFLSHGGQIFSPILLSGVVSDEKFPIWVLNRNFTKTTARLPIGYCPLPHPATLAIQTIDRLISHLSSSIT